ncbi:MAG: hypothetical protein H3C38_07165 [Rhodospirillales bacterium]|nr:hypothetical protein [Rhodospirillales bacterium]
MAVLRAARELGTNAACRHYGISPQTYYRYRRRAALWGSLVFSCGELVEAVVRRIDDIRLAMCVGRPPTDLAAGSGPEMAGWLCRRLTGGAEGCVTYERTRITVRSPVVPVAVTIEVVPGRHLAAASSEAGKPTETADVLVLFTDRRNDPAGRGEDLARGNANALRQRSRLVLFPLLADEACASAP